jgi:hypothetical protein
MAPMHAHHARAVEEFSADGVAHTLSERALARSCSVSG